jgi:hypothetical protein
VHFPAAVGALGTIDSGPHATRGSKNAFVDLFWLQMALGLQEKTKPVILALLFLCLQAYLDKIESHICLLFSPEECIQDHERRHGDTDCRPESLEILILY